MTPIAQAEAILKIAEKGASRAVDSLEPKIGIASKDQRQQLLETLEGGRCCTINLIKHVFDVFIFSVV